jgi:hypothetical protein
MLNPIVIGGPDGASARTAFDEVSIIAMAVVIAVRASVRFPFRNMLSPHIHIVPPTDTTITAAGSTISSNARKPGFRASQAACA